MPTAVIWSYSFFAAVCAAGAAALVARGDWARARGADRLLVLAPIFYAAPLTAFGVEHFTQTASIAALIPKWMPWHLFWTYAIGAGFVLGGFSLATGILARIAAPIVAATFFVFVVLMDLPAWAANPGDRFGMVLALRELAFSGGALACAAPVLRDRFARPSAAAAAVARWFIAAPALFYSVVQFRYPANVPGIPLRPLTPTYIPLHTYWPYFGAVAAAVTGLFLLAGRKARAAATWLGVSVLVVEIGVYVPMAVVLRRSLVGFNFVADTLMFCGATLLVARAMPRETPR